MGKKNGQNILAVIPARGGSKGIPGKNVRLVVNKPLIAYSIDAGKNARLVSRVVVSTDDEEIARVARDCGAEVIMRPPELAEDKTPMDLVLYHVVETVGTEGYVPDIVVLLQPTSPLRTSRHVDEALQKFLGSSADSLVSVFMIKNNRHEIGEDEYLLPTFAKSLNRNERPAAVFENGAIYVSKIELIKAGKIRGGRIGYYEMDQYSSIDIDEPRDLLVAEQLLKAQSQLQQFS